MKVLNKTKNMRRRFSVKLTARQWLLELEVNCLVIIDPDGWRKDDGVDFDTTPIGFKEFATRVAQCTIKISKEWSKLHKEASKMKTYVPPNLN